MHAELIPAHPSFAELWMQWRAEAHTVRHNPLAPGVTVERLRERLAQSCSDLRDLSAATEFSFFARVDGEVAASLTVKPNLMMGTAEIGYTVGEKFQGRGVGTAVVHALVEKIFAETRLRRLVALVAEGNVPSRRLLQRIGFVEEGTLREHYVINGVPTNEIFYGLLRSDYQREG